MATCKALTETMGAVMRSERTLTFILLILLAISMYTNDNCEVKEASEKMLQPFFFDPRAEWEK